MMFFINIGTFKKKKLCLLVCFLFCNCFGMNKDLFMKRKKKNIIRNCFPYINYYFNFSQ